MFTIITYPVLQFSQMNPIVFFCFMTYAVSVADWQVINNIITYSVEEQWRIIFPVTFIWRT